MTFLPMRQAVSEFIQRITAELDQTSNTENRPNTWRYFVTSVSANRPVCRDEIVELRKYIRRQTSRLHQSENL